VISLRWQDDAACAEIGSEFFFPDDANTANKCNYRVARSICAACPVSVECLEYALADGIPHGMWGGLTPGERSRLRGAA